MPSFIQQMFPALQQPSQSTSQPQTIQITQAQIDAERNARASEQKALLGTKQSEATKNAQDYFIKSQQAKDRADQKEYDLEKYRQEQLAQGYSMAGQYATGDYATEDILGWAEASAGRNIRNNELRKQELVDYTKQGYTPVYDYPEKVSNRSIIGYTKPTTPTVTDVPANYIGTTKTNDMLTSTSKDVFGISKPSNALTPYVSGLPDASQYSYPAKSDYWIPDLSSVKKWQLGVTSKITGTPYDTLAKQSNANINIETQRNPVMAKLGEVGQGYYSGIQQHPYLTIGSFAIGGASGYAFSGAGTLATRVIGPTATTMIGEGIGYTVPVLYGGYTASRIASSNTPYKTAGSILSTEVSPAIAGGILVPKGVQYIRTFGRTELPAPQVVAQYLELASGGKSFPTAPPSQHLNLFETQSQRLPITKLEGYSGTGKLVQPTEYSDQPFKAPAMLYHSTGKQFWNGKEFAVTQPGTSEFKGVFGSYGSSPHFLRVSSSRQLYSGGNAFQSYGKPATLGVIPTEFVPGVSAKLGQAFVPGATGFPKTEVQAILPVGTSGKVLSSDYYYKWGGLRIPLDVAKTSSSPTASISTRSFPTSSSSSSIASSTSALTPSSFLGLSSLKFLSKPTSNRKNSLKSLTSSQSISSSFKIPISSPTKFSSNKYTPSYSSSTSLASLSSYSPRMSTPSYSPPYSPSISTPSYSSPASPMAFPLGNFGDNLGTRRYKGKQRKKYTPDFKSLIFNIQGKMPKGIETGARARPIPKGYSFAFSKPKFNFKGF